MSEVRATVEQLSGEIKTYKFVDFTSELKIGLSSVERISLVYGILENAKACLYGNKAAYDVFQTNPITVMFLTLNKHPVFQQRYKMIHRQP